MKCLKCLKTINGKPKLKFNKYLSHFSNWAVCKECVDVSVKKANENVHSYYIKNKERYTKLQKSYKKKLTDSYVANVLVDRTNLKAKDVPQEVVDAKRQYMKVNRLFKEEG